MVFDGLAAAVRFLPRAWRAAWAALALFCALLFLALSDGAPAPWVGVIVLALIARGALWRLATGAGRAGPGGLQFGRPEARLAATWLLAGLFLSIIVLLAFVVVLCGAYAAASTGAGFDPAVIATWSPAIAGPGRWLLGAVATLCGVGLAYAATRISLAEAATVERGRIQMLSTFALTRGRSLFLAAGYLILAAPAILIAVVGSKLGGGRGVAIAESLAIGGLWLPSSVGLMAYAYRLASRKS